MKYSRYPEYRASGVEWLGAVPKHWDLKNLKYVATCNDEALSENTPADYRINYVDISSVSLEEGVKRTEEYDFDEAPSRARRRVQDGDTILSTVRTYLKAVACITKPPANLIVSTGFAVIRPGPDLDARYLSYYVRSEGFVGEVVSHSVGVSYPAINASQVMDLPALLPPLSEQSCIASFLDIETARIDDLISAKRRFMARLKEKRSALISRAVTSGIGAGIAMVKSEIKWLSEHPAHWEKRRLRYLFHMEGGMTPDRAEPRYWDGDIPWVTPKDMKVEVIADSEDHVTTDALAETGLSIVDPNAVLIVVRGMILAHSVPIALTAAPVTVNQDMKALYATDEVRADYLAWMFRGLRGLLLSLVEESGHGTKVLRTDVLRSVQVPLPPLPEQKAIVDELAIQTARIDKLLTNAKAAVDVLQQRRTSLISAAVTGSVDVRNAA